MTKVIKNDKKKTWGGVQIFGTGVEPAEMEMSPTQHQKQIKGATQVRTGEFKRPARREVGPKFYPKRCHTLLNGKY